MRINRIELAVALARKEMPVKRLAELASLSLGTVTAVKNGKSCSEETARKLAEVLGPDIIEKED